MQTQSSGLTKLVTDALQCLEVEAAGFAAAASGNGNPPSALHSELVADWHFGASLFARVPLPAGGPS